MAHLVWYVWCSNRYGLLSPFLPWKNRNQLYWPPVHILEIKLDVLNRIHRQYRQKHHDAGNNNVIILETWSQIEKQIQILWSKSSPTEGVTFWRSGGVGGVCLCKLKAFLPPPPCRLFCRYVFQSGYMRWQRPSQQILQLKELWFRRPLCPVCPWSGPHCPWHCHDCLDCDTWRGFQCLSKTRQLHRT